MAWEMGLGEIPATVSRCSMMRHNFLDARVDILVVRIILRDGSVEGTLDGICMLDALEETNAVVPVEDIGVAFAKNADATTRAKVEKNILNLRCRDSETPSFEGSYI